jgi:predicted Ser/Thr protein kinase
MTSLRDCVGPYRLLEEIGVGGMGEVYLALDPDGRTVAVKVLHPVVARDEVARRRLEREVATMRRVRSPYVAEVLDADFAARRPYVVTRYVQGRSLDEKVRAGGPLRGAALLRVAQGLARALHAIHEAGIVHRDLKPANVISLGENPVVIDFGLAHVLDATRLTRTGTAIGTPGYLAPEILDGDRAGPAADVFSWGATVVFAAAGRSPYGSGPAQAVFSRVLRGRFELDGVPGDLLPLVEAALAIDPARRPGTGDLLENLAARARPRPKTAHRPATAAPRRPVSARAGSPDGRVRPPDARPQPVIAGPARPENARAVAESPGGERRPVTTAVPAGRSGEPPGPRRHAAMQACALLGAPIACYTLPAVAFAVTLSICAAGYTWDALARAWRRMAATRGGGLARAGAGLAALIAVPMQTVVRLAVLLLALLTGYSAVLTATWWYVTPHPRGLALPLGVLAVVAGAVRAWYAAERRAGLLAVSVVAAGLLAAAVAGIPYPAWWPLALP